MGRLERDDAFSGGSDALLVGGSAGNPVHRPWGRGCGWQHGGQRGTFRDFQFGSFRHRYDGCVVRRGQPMHDSFTPLGGFVPLFNIQLGEIIVGGVGAGLYGMLVFVVLAVFIAGLMVGRTPEYLGKKIQAYEVKMAMLGIAGSVRVHSRASPPGRQCSHWGLAGLNNAGPHGLSEMLYA